VNLRTNVAHDAQGTNSFDEFVLLQGMRRPRHDVDADSAPDGANQALDDDRILVALVL
jgi:hypothetical protein